MSKLVLFFGDSITDCGRNRDDDCSLGAGYSAFAAARIGVDEPGKYRFINRGIGGNQISDLVSRMDNDVLSHKPDYMSILVGANDLSKNYMELNRLRIDRFENLYKMLIEDTKKELPNVKIMLLTPFVLPHKQHKITYAECAHFKEEELLSGIEKFADATIRIAKSYSLPCANLHERFKEVQKLAPAEYWSRDGYHPTPAGHEIIAREWLKLFEAIK